MINVNHSCKALWDTYPCKNWRYTKNKLLLLEFDLMLLQEYQKFDIVMLLQGVSEV